MGVRVVPVGSWYRDGPELASWLIQCVREVVQVFKLQRWEKGVNTWGKWGLGGGFDRSRVGLSRVVACPKRGSGS